MYDAIAILKTDGAVTYDDYGNEITTMIEREVFVQPRGVYAREFYNAAQIGLHPEITFELSNREDYNGERIIEFEGKDYTIIRADWTAQRDKMSLICEERTNVN